MGIIFPESKPVGDKYWVIKYLQRKTAKEIFFLVLILIISGSPEGLAFSSWRN